MRLIFLIAITASALGCGFRFVKCADSFDVGYGMGKTAGKIEAWSEIKELVNRIESVPAKKPISETNTAP